MLSRRCLSLWIAACMALVALAALGVPSAQIARVRGPVRAASPRSLSPASERDLDHAPTAVGSPRAKRTLAGMGPASAGRVLGRVRTLAGHWTVPGVDVELRTRGPDGRARSLRTRTNADGRFELEAAGHLERVLVPEGSWGAGTSVELERALANGEECKVELFLPPLRSIAGRVVDERGLAVPGARVELWTRSLSELDPFDPTPADRTTTSGPEGRFRLHAVGSKFVLQAGAPGLAARSRISVETSDRTDVGALELVLARLHAGTVRVVDSDGRAVARATVHARPTWTRAVEDSSGIPVASLRASSSSTDEHGEVEVDYCVGDVFLVTVEQGGVLRWQEAWSPAGDLEITLPRLAELSGLVVDARGGPVAGAEVRLAGRNRRAVRTDTEGRFHLRGLHTDEHARLLAHAPEAGASVPLALDLAAGASRSVQLALRSGATLRGTVVDATGAPVEGARLALQAPASADENAVVAPRFEWAGGPGRARAGRDGRFALGPLPEGRYAVEVSAPGGSELVTLETGVGDARVVLSVPRAEPGSLRGQVVDAGSGWPVPGFNVQLVVPPSRPGACARVSSHALTSPEGRFELRSPTPGEVEVRVSAPGFAPWRARLPGSGAERRVELRASAALRLRLVDAAGTTLPGVRLSFHERAGRDALPLELGPTSLGTRVVTGPDGQAVVRGLPVGRLLLEASAERTGCERVWIDLRDASGPEPRTVALPW